jgi:amidase
MPLEQQTVAALAALMASGEVSAETLTTAYLDRIERLDRAGPSLRSIIEVNPDAVAIAVALDRERAERGPRGPLHGVPIVLKDNIDTGDAMMTTAGSLAMLGHRAPSDAFVVARLRQAGAVVLAKTNLSEWANFRSSRSASGWSSRGGQTRNPYALDRTPCGSSSGSGVAVAAALAAAAIGTETDGSITCPASVNGVVGLKPTVGLVSRSGIVPISASQDTAGPMTRSVEDAAIVLSAMVGVDEADPASRDGRGRAADDYRAFLRADALAGARLGVVRSMFGFHEAVDEVAEAAIALMRDLGAEIVDGVDLSGVALARPSEREVFLYEFKAGLDAYLAAHPTAPVRSLADVIAFNRAHAATAMPYFRQELLEAAQAKGGLHESAYGAARAACLRAAREDGIDKALREHRVDALIAPTTAPAWVVDPIVGDRFLGSAAMPAAVAGYPHLTVPAGAYRGLPIGVSFFAGAYSEGRLLGLGHAFEVALAERRGARSLPELAEHAVL